MIAQPKNLDPLQELEDLAQSALTECNGDRIAALACVKRWLRADPEMNRRIMRALADEALAIALDHAARKDTPRPIRALPNPDRGAAGIVAMVNRTLLDYELSNGQRLGDASPHAILTEQYMHEKVARWNAGKARWFSLIHEAMGHADRVRDVLSDVALLELRQRAEAGE